MQKVALCDGDIVVAKAAYAAETRTKKEIDGEWVTVRDITSEQDCIWNIDSHLATLERNLPDYTPVLFIGGQENFRKRIDPNYKGNRDPEDKPLLYDLARDYMMSLGAYLVNYIEVDDMLGILQTRNDDTIICSIDKDLNTIPGAHYNLDHQIEYWVEPEDAFYSLCCQMLVGDSSDNIVGIKGVGEKKSAKALQPEYPDELSMWEVVKSYYQKQYEDDWESKMMMNLDLLGIMKDLDMRGVIEPEELEEIAACITEVESVYS